jgi:hypothetical protein
METVFLACFLFGLLFTVATAVLGNIGHALPHLHGADTGHAGHGVSAGHGPDVAHGHGGTPPEHAQGGHGGLPIVNASSLMAFLMWFGAAGYVLSRFTALPLALAIAGGVAAGAAGAAIVAAFLKLVLAGERVMDPRDYRLEGTIARVSVTIPEGGAGEILFAKAGTQRSEAARSLDGRQVARDTEVVIIDYERGIAAVQPWDQFIARADRRQVEGSLPSAGAES